MSPLWVGMLVSLGVSSVAAPFIFKMLVAMKSRQTVSEHLKEHAHKQGTPTMGGLIVLVGLLAGMAAVWHKSFVAPLVLIVGFGLVGFMDDYLIPKWKPGSRGLSWIPKLSFEIGACLLATLFMGWKEPILIGLFVFMVLFLSNAYNFSDGLDTLAGGLGLILALGFASMNSLLPLPSPLVGYFNFYDPDAIAASQQLHMSTGILMMMLAVAFLAFLVLNAAPAKIFMGDVGALPIGAVFGWAASMTLIEHHWYYGPTLRSPGTAWAVGIALVIMLIEIVPVPLQIASVKLRKKRLFPFKTPVHHALQDFGWPETRIAMLFHAVQIGLVVVACALISLGVNT